MARRVKEHPELAELRALLSREYVKGEQFRELVFLTARHGLLATYEREQLRACCFALTKTLGMGADEAASVLVAFVTRLGLGDEKAILAVRKLVTSYAKRRAAYDRHEPSKPERDAHAANAYSELPALLTGQEHNAEASQQQMVAPVVSLAEYRARRAAGQLPHAG
jgi:hypothetical protein